LVGAGLVNSIRTCYFGLEAFGLAPQFTQAASDGTIQIIEESEASLANGIRASMAGVGFMPSVAWIGTELPALRQDVKTVIDPYSGEELTAFPAIEVDVAVIHALAADEEGNAQIGGNKGVDVELALIAKTVIVTAEKITPPLAKADILAPTVDAVVHAPRGAWPSSCHPLYPLDGMAVLDYLSAESAADYWGLVQGWAEELDLPPFQVD
jgi:glutaconate CoA-transferase subunit A